MRLRELHQLPEEILQLEAHQLHQHLGGPCLIHLPGRRPEPLFVSVLLHGNETVGWEAVRKLLQSYNRRQVELPRSLSIFLGNLAAAEQHRRVLEGQQDFNRVWPGSSLPRSPEHELVRQVYETMDKRGVFASLDLHNNTGLNPHYGCINRIFAEDLGLASMFGRILVYFTRPLGVQSLAMGELCPAVTLECGKVGNQAGIQHALEYLDACLHLQSIPTTEHSLSGVELFQTVAIVRVPGNVSFGFGSASAQLSLDPELERNNFNLVPAGWRFGRFLGAQQRPLEVIDEQGLEVFEHYFEQRGDEVITRKAVMPSMLTTDLDVIRGDCLCYLMEPVEIGNSIASRQQTPRS